MVEQKFSQKRMIWFSIQMTFIIAACVDFVNTCQRAGSSDTSKKKVFEFSGTFENKACFVRAVFWLRIIASNNCKSCNSGFD